MSLVNLYKPRDNDNPNFFDIIENHLEKIGNEIIILGGDWNCILSVKIDARNYASVINRLKTRARIKNVMTKWGLTDIYRELYSNNHEFTWRRFNSIKQSRRLLSALP